MLNVIQGDVRHYSGKGLRGIDLLAGGVPCPPFSKAGKQLGDDDERDLFPEALRLVEECQPSAVMLETVRGLLDSIFDDYRANLIKQLAKLGYHAELRLLNARDYGVPQLRPRVIFVALRKEISHFFDWPEANKTKAPTVGKCLHDLMVENGWRGAGQWSDLANDITPTLVGGSKKHGGPDLGPTRARKAWEVLHVDGRGLADSAPDRNFIGMPRLTVKMAARIQGFPDDWQITGKKTSSYRQVGNAFPPPVAEAVGLQIYAALNAAAKPKLKRA